MNPELLKKTTSELTDEEYQLECWPLSHQVKERWEQEGKPDDIYSLFPYAFKTYIRSKFKNFNSLP